MFVMFRGKTYRVDVERDEKGDPISFLWRGEAKSVAAETWTDYQPSPVPDTLREWVEGS